MAGDKRKKCDKAQELAAALATVDAIIERIHAVQEPRDSHLLPGLLVELDVAAGRRNPRHDRTTSAEVKVVSGRETPTGVPSI
jgi:hypothetical protein